jgi:hypothetical protein
VWQHYTNKLHALVIGEAASKAEHIAWLDSDILILGEPSELALNEGEDFVALPDLGVIGTTGGDHPYEEFWRRVANAFGMEVDALPWVPVAQGQRIRLYFNSGVFVYRRSSGLAREYLADCEAYLDRNVPKTHDELHFMDQVTLGLTVVRLGLAWRALSIRSNYFVTLREMELLDPGRMEGVSVLHYHDTLSGGTWNSVVDCLRRGYPCVAQWLEPQGPIGDPSPRIWRLAREFLRMWRGFARQRYYKSHGIVR